MIARVSILLVALAACGKSSERDRQLAIGFCTRIERLSMQLAIDEIKRDLDALPTGDAMDRAVRCSWGPRSKASRAAGFAAAMRDALHVIYLQLESSRPEGMTLELGEHELGLAADSFGPRCELDHVKQVKEHLAAATAKMAPTIAACKGWLARLE